VFICQHLLLNAKSVTGGFYGRNAPPFSLFGFSFTDANPRSPSSTWSSVSVSGCGTSAWRCSCSPTCFARNVLRSRPGRALQTIRDSEVAAAVMGVNVRRYKAGAFVLSSMYAGLAGVLIALAFQRPVPDYFDLRLSITYLAMIVIGGLGSVGGAVAGAAFVTALPLVLTHYSNSLTFLAQPGQNGIGPAEFSNYVYGAAVIVVLLVAPGGLAVSSADRPDVCVGPSRSTSSVPKHGNTDTARLPSGSALT